MVNPIQYNRSISIHPVHGENFYFGGDMVARPLSGGDARSFLKRAKDALDKLYKLPTGRRLLEEINGSGKTCKIYCVDLGPEADSTKGGAAFPIDPSSMVQTVNRMAIPFLPVHMAFTNSTIRATPETLREAFNDFNNPNTHIVNELAKTELARVMQRASQQFSKPWQRLADLTGIDFGELIAMSAGLMKCSADQYLRIAIAFYDFLTPGPGCDTQVRLLKKIGIESDKDHKPWQNQYKRDGSSVRPDIMAGHELIHAWRMMTGRRVVSSGYEEEMMTVGLGPCFGWPFTENKLRMEAGHPLRLKYPLTASSDFGTSLRDISVVIESQVRSLGVNPDPAKLNLSLRTLTDHINHMQRTNSVPTVYS